MYIGGAEKIYHSLLGCISSHVGVRINRFSHFRCVLLSMVYTDIWIFCRSIYYLYDLRNVCVIFNQICVVSVFRKLEFKLIIILYFVITSQISNYISEISEKETLLNSQCHNKLWEIKYIISQFFFAYIHIDISGKQHKRISYHDIVSK